MKRFFATILCALLLALPLSACAGGTPRLDPKNPVTLSMWHNYGGDMQKSMDELIDEFNGTIGREKGILITVEAISSSAELQESLNSIAAGDPGAPKMPDITTSYPKTAILFESKGMLANLDEYLSAEDRSAYVEPFLEEGRLGDGGLYVFPLAKSTEILYLNQTLFDRFAAETGVTMESLQSFEGIADAAAKYYAWTDTKTPDVPGDGKQFYAADSWFNFAQAGALQQGESLFDGENLALQGEAYRRIFKACFAPSVAGGFAIYDGYSSDLSKTGDLVCSTGSSAGILFYGDTITTPDNRTEQVEYSILPFPIFQGGKKIAIQRGNGLVVAKSDKRREYAAFLFLKWLTSPEINLRFVAATGYLPVTKEAFETLLPRAVQSAENPRVRQMLETVTEMQASYDFFVAPTFEDFDALSKRYEADYKALLTAEREAYLTGGSYDLAAREEAALAAFSQNH
ncbi:MAG: extracellular solute-binding protein [Christensenellaceae bacterium]|jgi:multiple sugar transport system substrate-binding protein|nr:extracellular solute-binding protein [Christensenellaceae bacterium]